MHASLLRCASLAALLLMLGAWAAPAADDPAVLVSGGQAWRKHYTCFPPVVEGLDPATAPKAGGSLPLGDSIYKGLFQALPPAEWTQRGFDDSGWLLREGGEFDTGIRDAKIVAQLKPDETSVYLRSTDPFCLPVGLVCQRAVFTVPDRRRVSRLTLTLTYRGGFVARLNGAEVARGHVPDGPVEPRAAATPYPPEAFFYRDSLAKGRPRPLDVKDARCDQWPLRERTAGPLDVPVSLLQDGENVLALELHRAAYPAACRQDLVCATVGLSVLELHANPPLAPAASASGGQGLDVWAADLARTLYDPAASHAAERRAPIRIVSTRNGVFSGQVIVDGGRRPLDGLRARVSALRSAAGAMLPADAVQVRYGARNPFWPAALSELGMAIPRTWRRDAGGGPGVRFDLLLDTPPAGATALPVWVSVRTAKDTPPGEYRGEVAVAVPGASAVQVPLVVEVAAWTLPDVRDYAGLLNLYQSPETLAQYYRVAPWSEAHWKLIERSFRLMGEMGNIGLFIPLLAESQMGNPESMVVWTRQPDGTYTYDFGVFDRYLDTALRHHTRLRFVALNVWGYEASLRLWKNPRDYATFYGARVTVVDASGRRESMKLPPYGTPECEALWKPLLHALRDRLRARGLEDRLLLGLTADMGPDVATAAMFERILPGGGWISESHQLTRLYVYDPATHAGMPVHYNSIVYGGDIPDPAQRRLYGWQPVEGTVVLNFNRSGSCLLLMGYPPPWSFRMWMESTFAYGRRGNGRVGADYWHIGAPLLGEGPRGWGVEGGSGGTLFGRYLHSHADEAGLGRNCTDLFGAGPDGPIATVRLENAREGNQEAEARAFIERTLLDRTRPLPPDLAARCRALLDERTHVLRLWKLGAAGIAPFAWQERSRALYRAAADVAAALGARG